MAPKTRHLAQGKRKRANRRQGAAPVPSTPARSAAGVPPADLGDAAGSLQERSQRPATTISSAASSPVGPVARRSTSVRTSRPYDGGNRARAAVRPDTQRPGALPRATEYAFIRSDMHRLLLTAGSLAIVMIVLLFLLDG